MNRILQIKRLSFILRRNNMETDARQLVDDGGLGLWLLDLTMNYEEGYCFPVHALENEA